MIDGYHSHYAFLRESQSIHEAVANDCIMATDYYLKTAQVGPNARDRRTGDSPLHVAARRGRDVLARMLIHNGANVDQRNKNGWSPLHTAAAAGSLELVALLWANGADIEARDRVGYTPLMRAAKEGRFACCRFLVDRRGGVSKTSRRGRTAENLAAGGRWPTLARMLNREAGKTRTRAAGGRRRPEDLGGRTIGHLAVDQRCGSGAGPDGEKEWSYMVFCSECRTFVTLGTAQVKAGACCPRRGSAPEVALRLQALSHPFRQKGLAQ